MIGYGNAVTASIMIESRAISDPFDILVTEMVHDDYLFDHYGYLLVHGSFPPQFRFKGTCLPQKFMRSLTLFFFSQELFEREPEIPGEQREPLWK